MRVILAVLSITTAMCGAAAAEAPRVAVLYADPVSFIDVTDGYAATDAARDAYLAELKRFIERRATGRVPEGQQLTITITDIDMAGRVEPWRGARFADVRIVRDVQSARIALEFKLLDAGGTLLKGGERKLQSLGYPLAPGVYASDPLRYEKTMIANWLEHEFPQ